MHLLIAIEGDEHSEQTIRLGLQLARQVDGNITVLTVAEHESERAQSEAILAEALSRIGPTSMEMTSKVVVGETASEILAEAEVGQYELLIIGMRPSHSFLKRLQGLVSEQVMARAPCPVLIVKGEARPIHTILVCSSGAAGYEGPTRSMVQLAPIFDGDAITLLHVMSQISATPNAPHGWQLLAGAGELIEEATPEGRLLEERAAILRQAGYRVQAKVRHGLVVDEILDEACNGDHELVVIGAHVATGWRRHLLDDVARQIVNQVDILVLVVPTVDLEAN
ncbi:MAG: universal stress protein [Chloroflexota bacterium]|jgi:nucleotide-binding universal stress UspA family protein